MLLTCLVESALNLDLRVIEVRLLPNPQIVPDIHNGLQPLHRPFGKVIKAFIVLVALHRVKLG